MRGAIHHLQPRVRDVTAAETSWRWLPGSSGYTPDTTGVAGAAWRTGDAYIVVESGPDVLPATDERRCPGLNHLGSTPIPSGWWTTS